MGHGAGTHTVLLKPLDHCVFHDHRDRGRSRGVMPSQGLKELQAIGNTALPGMEMMR